MKEIWYGFDKNGCVIETFYGTYGEAVDYYNSEKSSPRVDHFDTKQEDKLMNTYLLQSKINGEVFASIRTKAEIIDRIGLHDGLEESMQEFVKKLIDRLEEWSFEAEIVIPGSDGYDDTANREIIRTKNAIEIVNELAEEYNNESVNTNAIISVAYRMKNWQRRLWIFKRIA